MDSSLVLETIAKVTIAAILGGAIGFERETHGQFAGFRTNLLVSVGACLMMMLSLHMPEIFRNFSADSPLRIDPGRIASYAIASMGFLGGGAIIKGRGSVRGLTTAGSLWLVTGIGLAVGAGFLFPAAMATGMSLVILYNFLPLKQFIPHRQYTTLSLTCNCEEGSLHDIREALGEYQEIHILFVNYIHDLTRQSVTYRLRLYTNGDLPWGRIVKSLRELPGMQKIAWIESDVP